MDTKTPANEGPFLTLYRKSPAKARRELWRVHQESGSIKATARLMGCARNTIRRLLRRRRAGDLGWSNRPSTPKGPRRARDARRPGRLVVVSPHVLGRVLQPRVLASTGVFLMRTSAS